MVNSAVLIGRSVFCLKTAMHASGAIAVAAKIEPPAGAVGRRFRGQAAHEGRGAADRGEYRQAAGPARVSGVMKSISDNYR